MVLQIPGGHKELSEARPPFCLAHAPTCARWWLPRGHIIIPSHLGPNHPSSCSLPPVGDGEQHPTGTLQLLSLVPLQIPRGSEEKESGWEQAVGRGSAGCRWPHPAQGARAGAELSLASQAAAALPSPALERAFLISPVCSSSKPRQIPPRLLQRLLPRSPDLITAGAAGAEAAVTRNVLKGREGSGLPGSPSRVCPLLMGCVANWWLVCRSRSRSLSCPFPPCLSRPFILEKKPEKTATLCALG